MPNQKIELKGYNPTTYKLELTNHGNVYVNSHWTFRSVKWKIKDSRIKSFKIIPITLHYPFEEPIPADYGSKVKLKVKYNEAVEWEYSIDWKDEAGAIHHSDPIISINTTFTASFIVWFFALVLGVFGISLFWGKKKRDK